MVYNLLAEVELHNIKSISHYVFQFPEKGLVRFAGPNGSGKSIIVDTLDELLTFRINDLHRRKSLIKRPNTEGWMIMKRHDGKQLKLYLNFEASKTYVEYTDENGNTLRRYLADKKQAVLACTEMFGYHYDQDRNISLNIYTTFKEILFVGTSPRLNYDVVEVALGENNLNRCIDSEQMLIEDLESSILAYRSDAETAQIILDNLPVYDEVANQTIVNLCTEITATVSALQNLFEIEPLDIIPDITPIEALTDVFSIEPLDSISSTEDVNSILALSNLFSIEDIDFSVDDVTIHAIDALSNVFTIDDIDFVNNISEVYAIVALHRTEILKQFITEIELCDISEIKSVISIMDIDLSMNIVELEHDYQLIENMVAAINSLETLFNIEDDSYDLIRLGQLSDAIKYNTCPLCGSKIRKEDEQTVC